jgi:hypothetical protein
MRSRIVRFLAVAVALLAVAVLAAGWAGLFAGTRPALGVGDGMLMPCPPTPNCVASQADPADAGHHIAPIVFRTDATAAWAALVDAVSRSERAVIVASGSSTTSSFSSPAQSSTYARRRGSVAAISA